MINSYRNLSFRQLKEIKPMITRNLAWFNQQSIKQNFGKRKRSTNSYFLLSILATKLKRRLRNLLIVTVVGFGTYYSYRSYRRYTWFKNMNDSDNSIGTKPRVVVLGTGE